MTDQTIPSTAETVRSSLRTLPRKLKAYWALVKDLQTGLLLITGLAGYMSGRPAQPTWPEILSLLGSFFLTVGGSTVLNMVVDRDIDGKMART